MSYCTGKNIEIARGKAVKMLVVEKKPVESIADRFGVHRSTVWRWHQKWKKTKQPYPIHQCREKTMPRSFSI